MLEFFVLVQFVGAVMFPAYMPITPLSQFKPKATSPGGGSLLIPMQAAEDFCQTLKPGARAELIGGKVCVRPPHGPRELALATLIHELTRRSLEALRLPGVLHREPFLLRLGHQDVFMPELCYFAEARSVRLGLTQASIAPALVVELGLAERPAHEQEAKLASYEQHGVQECWSLDVRTGHHRFYRRGGKRLEEFAARGEKIVSATLSGFWLRRDWLAADKLPKAEACLKEIMRGVR